MSDEFADVPSEGAKLEIDQALDRLSAKEDKSSSESQPEKKETVKPSQGGENSPDVKPEPFHKHPRWIKMKQEMKEKDARLAELEKAKQNNAVIMPDWWKRQYGDTEESRKRYESVVQKDGELDWIKQNILTELENRQKAEQVTAKEGQEYVDTQLAEMADEGLKFEKNVLLKFMVDFQKEFGAGALLDSEGNYDFRKSLTLMEKMSPAEENDSSDVRKQLAAAGQKGKVSAQRSTNIPILSRNTLRKGNWRDAETGKFISR